MDIWRGSVGDLRTVGGTILSWFELSNKCWCAGILSQNDYLNLVQCETLEDLKLHLQSTDYGNFLANESTLQVNFCWI